MHAVQALPSDRVSSILRNGGLTAYSLERQSTGKPAEDNTVRWAFSHPDAFLGLTAGRCLEFWFPTTAATWYSSVTLWLTTGLAFPGAFLLVRRGVPVNSLIIAVAAIYPLWLSLLCAGYLLSDLAKRLSTQPAGFQGWGVAAARNSAMASGDAGKQQEAPRR